MANTVTTTSITEGARGGVMHLYLASDGSTGELSDTVVLDASALIGGDNIRSIVSVESSLVGFSAILEFDATADVPAVVLPEGESNQDFTYAPIPNTAGAGVTGDLTISTTGFSASGDVGTVTIRYRK